MPNVIHLGPPHDCAPPETLLVEAPGCLLSWPVEATSPIPSLHISSLADADWLWQLIGEDAYGALVDSTSPQPAWNLDLAATLHALGLHYWARSWWPASEIDNIPALDPIELTRDLNDLVESLAAVMDLPLEQPLVSGVSQADYALAAGSGMSTDAQPIAQGRAPVAWQSVPPGLVDATESPLTWRIEARPHVIAHLHLATLPGMAAEAAGLAIRVGETHGVLDDTARVDLILPLAGAAAWTTRWEDVEMQVGVEVSEPAELRERVRRYARERAGHELPAAATAWAQVY